MNALDLAKEFAKFKPCYTQSQWKHYLVVMKCLLKKYRANDIVSAMDTYCSNYPRGTIVGFTKYAPRLCKYHKKKRIENVKR